MLTALVNVLVLAVQPTTAATPQIIHASDRTTYVQNGIAAEPLVDRASGAYLGRLRFEPGSKVPPHRHATAEEMIVILSGEGVMKINGRKTPVIRGDAIYIPRDVEHDFETVGASPVEAIQVYSPRGPEERFRTWPRK